MTEEEYRRVNAILQMYEEARDNASALGIFLDEAEETLEKGCFRLQARRPYANDMGVLTRDLDLNHYSKKISEAIVRILREELTELEKEIADLKVGKEAQ